LPDFSLSSIPKRGKVYQIATKLQNGHKIYQLFKFPPKFAQILIFCFKIYHLATLVWFESQLLLAKSLIDSSN
jgi:hypothetical protein